jgi:hypothetical protein
MTNHRRPRTQPQMSASVAALINPTPSAYRVGPVFLE